MNPIHRGLLWCSKKTGLTERRLDWSIFAVFVMLLFIGLFILPQNTRIKQLDAENELTEAHLQEQVLLQMLDIKLRGVLASPYAKIEEITPKAFEERNLLELPGRFEELAAALNIALVSIDSSSVDDGAHVAIKTIFQGDMEQLYKLLEELGRIPYVSRLSSITILALPDAEQMELQFKVPIK